MKFKEGFFNKLRRLFHDLIEAIIWKTNPKKLDKKTRKKRKRMDKDAKTMSLRSRFFRWWYGLGDFKVKNMSAYAY